MQRYRNLYIDLYTKYSYSNILAYFMRRNDANWLKSIYTLQIGYVVIIIASLHRFDKAN